MSARRLAIATAILALAAAPAAAQGKGRGLSRGRGSTAAPSSSSSLVGVRQFGSWLDDASVVEPAHGFASISLGHYRSLGGRQTDFPIVDAAIGMTPRVQLGLSVPYHRLSFADGTRASGLGDVYLNAKVSVIDPAERQDGFGVAVSPLIEVLSDADPVSGKRFFWGAPVSVEWRQARYRVYGSTGYFSRGAMFGSGAVEVPVTQRLVATGVLVHTRALNDDSLADALGLSKTRTDLIGGTAFVLSPSMMAFASIGRTISTLDANASSLMISGGVAVTFAGQTAVRGRTR